MPKTIAQARAQAVPHHRGRRAFQFNEQALRCVDNYSRYCRALSHFPAYAFFIDGPYDRCPRCRTYVFSSTDAKRYDGRDGIITGCHTCLRSFCD